MAKAKTTKQAVMVTLTLTAREARDLYDLLGEGVFGTNRKSTTTPIFLALESVRRDLPEQIYSVHGRVELKGPF